MARVVWGDEIEIESAGIIARDGHPATSEAQQVAREIALDLSRHRARNVSRLDLARYDRIIALTGEIGKQLESELDVPGERIIRLEIDDPFGSDVESYRVVARRLDEAISEMAGEIATIRDVSTRAD